MMKSIRAWAAYALNVPAQLRYKFGAGRAITGKYERIYFYHIRKAAGTSLNHAFFDLGEEDAEVVYDQLGRRRMMVAGSKTFVGWNKPLIESGRYFYAFSHIPSHQLELPASTFTITCFRDPVQRVLSHYKYLLLLQSEGSSHNCLKREGPWLGNSFADFVKNMPPEHLFNQLYMFSESLNLNEAFDAIAQCNHLMFTEQFNKGLNQLSEKLGCSLQSKRKNRSRTDVMIREDEIEAARHRLHSEYDLLERVRELPQAVC